MATDKRGDDALKIDGEIREPGAAAGPPIGGYTALMRRTWGALWPRVALLVAAAGALIGAGAALGKRREGEQR